MKHSVYTRTTDIPVITNYGAGVEDDPKVLAFNDLYLDSSRYVYSFSYKPVYIASIFSNEPYYYKLDMIDKNNSSMYCIIYLYPLTLWYGAISNDDFYNHKAYTQTFRMGCKHNHRNPIKLAKNIMTKLNNTVLVNEQPIVETGGTLYENNNK